MEVKNWLAVALLFWLGCRNASEKQILHIERIFMHEPGSFTLFVASPPGSKVLSELYISSRYSGTTPLYVVDVPADQLMWLTYTENRSWWDGDQISNIVIHLHGVDEVSGGGWNHGKFGHGQTEVVQ